MGEVYRATDTKLGREVAIKVLPEDMTHDRERLARFEREARLLASLNHPNIAAIYGFEQAEGVSFLALELVEGEDLVERMNRGPSSADLSQSPTSPAPAPASSSAPPPTCRPSRPGARRSTGAPTSGPSAWCCGRC